MKLVKRTVNGTLACVVPSEGLAAVSTGAACAATSMVNACWAVLPAASVATRVTASVGVWAAVGVQEIKPVVEPTVIPVGFCVNW